MNQRIPTQPIGGHHVEGYISPRLNSVVGGICSMVEAVALRDAADDMTVVSQLRKTERWRAPLAIKNGECCDCLQFFVVTYQRLSRIFSRDFLRGIQPLWALALCRWFGINFPNVGCSPLQLGNPNRKAIRICFDPLFDGSCLALDIGSRRLTLTYTGHAEPTYEDTGEDDLPVI